MVQLQSKCIDVGAKRKGVRDKLRLLVVASFVYIRWKLKQVSCRILHVRSLARPLSLVHACTGLFFLRLSLVTPAHCKKESLLYKKRERLVQIHIPRSPPGHLRTNVLRKFCKIAS